LRAVGSGRAALRTITIPPWDEGANPTRRPPSASSQLCRPRKKLGRQTWLDEETLKFSQVRLWIAAEASALGPALPPRVQRLPQPHPLRTIGTGQIVSRECPLPRCRRCYQPRAAAQDQRRRAGFPAACPPLVVTLGAKELFQGVVRPRYPFVLVAGEQPRPVAAAHPQEVPHRARQPPRPPPVLRHRAQQPAQPAADAGPAGALRPENPSRFVDPAEGQRDRRPQRRRGLEAAVDQPLQLPQLRGQPPFSAARPRLAETAPSRSRSFSPLASSGGRPSSVRALRTAEQ
jgi:hypothetical protein